MSNELIAYLIFGLGFYIGASVTNPTSFHSASVADLLRGLILGIPLWPIGLIVRICITVEREAMLKKHKEAERDGE